MSVKRPSEQLQTPGQQPAKRARVELTYRDNLALQNVYTGSAITYKMSSILQFLSNIKTEEHSSGSFYVIHLRQTKIHLEKSINLKTLFSASNFKTNFEACWRNNLLFNSLFSTDFRSSRLPGVSIKVVNDLTNAPSGTCVFDILEQYAFRSLLCLFMSFYYDIRLPMCVCYPGNPAERLALDMGVGKNCYSEECRNYLLGNPYTYDPLVHSNCSPNLQVATVLLNNYFMSATSENVTTVNILQVIKNGADTYENSNKQ